MYIYEILNIKNNKRYIGQTIDASNRRFNTHRYLLNVNKHANSHLQAAWNKYGKSAFKFSKIEYASSTLQLDQLEIFYITKYKSDNRKFGYNVIHGGANRGPLPLETKLKIGLANKGNSHTKKQKLKWAIEKRKNIYAPYIIDPNGKKFKVISIRGFAKIHKLDRRNLAHVLLGKSIHTKFWRLPGVPKSECILGVTTSKTQRKYEYLPLKNTKTNTIHEIIPTMTAFCKLHNLNSAHIRALLKNERRSHQGWTLA